LKLWLADPTTTLAGLGLEVFFLITPAFAGTASIIHSTYVWLPVEMGIPGVIALIAFLYAVLWVARGLTRNAVDRAPVVAVIGSLLVFLFWIAANEGLYQRTLWLMLGLGGAILATHQLSTKEDA
jgi:FtsH-binding integral membrane protein